MKKVLLKIQKSKKLIKRRNSPGQVVPHKAFRALRITNVLKQILLKF